MRTLKFLLLIVSASLLLFSCGGGATPEAVVEKYIGAIKKADFEAVKDCLTKDAAADLDREINNFTDEDIQDMIEQNKDLKVKIIRSEITGDDAVVFYEQEHGDHSHEHSIPLRKEDGNWKISILY